MLLCSQYWEIITMGFPLGRKVTVASDISSLVKGLYERSIFSVGREEIFLPFINADPGDHTLPNLLLCSSNFTDEQYLRLLVCLSHNLIVSVMIV